jgi:hypothetical protein
VQVEVLHEKRAAQGLQPDEQSARSAAQSRSGQQELGHTVLTPSQVTDPLWAGQLWSVAEQLVVLLFPLQLMVPPEPQFAEAVQRAFPPRAGRFAAGTGAGVARAVRKA